MTEEEKLQQARQLLKRIIDKPPIHNEGQGDQCCYCERYTVWGNVLTHTPEAHKPSCRITRITKFLLED